MQYNLDEIDKVAQYILENSSSKILLFKGELGAGKTTLIKAIVSALGSTDHVSSPTFSLVNEYRGNEGPIYHFDLYRLENEEDSYNIGLDEYLESGHWCLIEWPEKALGVLPENCTFVVINKHLVGKRSLRLE